MTLYAVKPLFQGLLRPVVGRLAAVGVNANQVTIVAAIGSIICAALVAWFAAHPAIFLLIPAWLFVRMALNAADGMLAREFGQESQSVSISTRSPTWCLMRHFMRRLR